MAHLTFTSHHATLASLMRGIYKRGKLYYIDFSYKGRRYREPAGESFSLAQGYLAKRRLEAIEEFTHRTKKAERILFSDFADIYLEEHCKENNISWKTTECMLKQAKAFFQSKYLDEITVNDIEQYKARKKKKNTPATVNRHLACLNNLFNKAKYRWNYLQGDNPVKKVSPLKENNARTRFLTAEELQKLISVANPFLKLIILLAVNTGMRRGEMMGLKWTQVNWENKTIYLTKTKGNKRREIPMNGTAEWVLQQLKRGNSEWVFCKDSGEKYGNWRKAFQNAVKKAGLKDFRFHDLRHTFASHLVMNGKDLYTVQQLLGHATATMTQRYAHLSMEHKREAVNGLNHLNVTIASQAENIKNEKPT